MWVPDHASVTDSRSLCVGSLAMLQRAYSLMLTVNPMLIAEPLIVLSTD